VLEAIALVSSRPREGAPKETINDFAAERVHVVLAGEPRMLLGDHPHVGPLALAGPDGEPLAGPRTGSGSRLGPRGRRGARDLLGPEKKRARHPP